MTAMLTVSVASAIGTTAPSARPARSSGKLVRRVAEQKREHDRQPDGPPVGESERGADHHPGDLTESAAGEAVQGGAQGDGTERTALGRQLMVRCPACASIAAQASIPQGV